MKKIAEIVLKWDKGGVERFVERIIKSRYEYKETFTIISITSGISSEVKCNIIGPLCDNSNYLEAFINLRKIFRTDGFDIVHIHTNNAFGYICAYIASIAGINKIIIHSHNSSLDANSGKLKIFINKILCKVFSGKETDRVACSELAGDFLFGNKDYKVIKNGIDVNRFCFSLADREKIRNNLKIQSNCKVVGFIGSLVDVKNPRRAIDIFKTLKTININTKMIILGDGVLKDSLVNYINKLKLNNSIQIIGFVNNVSQYLSAFDCVLMTSLYEGLPISLVEAQCNGLNAVVSDTITNEVNYSGNIKYVSLIDDDLKWACIINDSFTRNSAENALNKTINSGYDFDHLNLSLDTLYN